MSRARAITRAANRRLWLASVVHAAGRSLTGAALGGVALVGVDRLFGWETPVWALLGVPAAAGVVVTGVLAARARRRAGDASVALDHALGLRDRISTANALDEDEADPFAALARQDAERVAHEASPRRALPVLWDSWWVAVPFAAAGLTAAAMFLPRYDVFGRAERRLDQAMLAHRRADAAEAMEQAREEIRRAAAEASSDLATPEQLRALEKLEQELAEGAIDPDDARANAASRLDDLAESLAERAAREREALDALRERFDSLAERPSDTPASALDEALRRGDFEDAAEALEHLRREAARDAAGSEAARERLAQDLQEIARALQRATEPPSGPDAPPPSSSSSPDNRSPEGGAPDPGAHEDGPRNERAFDALRERGLSPDEAERLADSLDPDALRDALAERGMTPEQADRLAEKIARDNREHEAQEQALRDLRELAETLERAAEDVRNPSDAPPGESPDAQPDSVESPQRDPSSRGSERPPDTTQRPPQQGEAQDAAQDKGDQNPAEREQGRRADASERQRESPQPGDKNAPSNQDGAQSPGEKESPDGQTGSRPDGTPTGEQSGRQGGNGAAERQTEAQQGENAADGPSEGGEQPGQGATNDGVGDAVRKMRELAQRRRIAEQGGEESQRIRERAQEMLERLTPEERAELQRLAEQIARERGAGAKEDFSGAAFEDVDARRGGQTPPDDTGRVIAEWLSEGRADRDGARGAVDARRRLAEAARGAQRAIEEQRTPPRYAEVIRRYFERLPDAVERAAPDAPDTNTAGDRSAGGRG